MRGRAIWWAAIAWFLLAARAWAEAPLRLDDPREIDAVVTGFAKAIVAKDKPALLRLAASDAITFMSSLDPETLQRLRARKPTARRVDVGSYLAFVDSVTSGTDRLEETFENVVIHVDGAVATVWFDYTFSENGRPTNRGHETWSLVRFDDGWKIAAIVYSITLPAP